jgi:hypothetical protein
MLHTKNSKIDDISTCKKFFKVKKVVAAKPNIEIEIRLHHRIPCNKLFKTRPHMNIFRKHFMYGHLSRGPDKSHENIAKEHN